MQRLYQDEMITLNDSTHRYKDENGHLIIKDNPVAVAGVLPFLKGQIDPSTSRDSNEIVYVFRSEESLKDAYQMFKDKPIVYNHKWVGKDGDTNNADGHIGSHVYYKDGGVYGDLIIYNSNLIDKIERGECTQLSAGYSAVTKPEKGTYLDKDYSYSIFYTGINHLAVVERGRAGVELSIKDKGIPMDFNNVFKNSRMDQGTDSTSVASPCEMGETKFTKKEAQKIKKETITKAKDTAEGNKGYQVKKGGRVPHSVYNLCKQRVKDGKMSPADMQYILDNFNINNVKLQKDVNNINKKLEYQKRLDSINKAVAEIRSFEITKNFTKLDDADPAVHYSRAYNYATKERLPDGMDARTAFLSYVKTLEKQRAFESKKRSTIPTLDNGLVKMVNDSYNALYHKQREINSLIKRRAF